MFTKQEFKALALSKAKNRGLIALNEARSYSENSSKTSIFLSHSHKDRELISQAKEFFENLGIRIYVDWADKTMPEKTSAETASKIKSQIRKNDKFILLAPNDAITSRWCNWEVGIGDAHKLLLDKICTLPLADNRDTWQGNEYLQIYPRIENSSNYNADYKIIYPNGNSDSLTNWLNK
ncbi:TIR domain-containing protein [Chitinophaga eiseniae]|uniref:TIR domain-containing protein n=1 Tax=Chitinophaga eiseniae TaxID=634771 RepID=A0A847SX43_9BACT|nr:TIR domain-containing protein [Chitinophaga eiseniae]